MKNTWQVQGLQHVSGAAALGVTVRVGMFFDGTGNNRVNSQIGADCRAMAEVNHQAHIRECRGRHDDPASSYGNDLSNIAHLAELYLLQNVAANHGDGLKVFYPIYISGVGTLSGGRDSFWPGQSFGRGATGVTAKVARSCKKLAARLEMFKQHNPGCLINRLELDVFGFSRGAAAARHFVNEVLKREQGALEAILRRRSVPLSPCFDWASGSVSIKLVGLFDTVAAVASLKDLGNVRDAQNNQVNLYLPPGCADQVVHLVARDEVRRNFALNSVAPHWEKEIILPGAHADIGGGYPAQMLENVLLSRPRYSSVGCDMPATSTSAWQETFADLQAMDASQWLDPLDHNASLAVQLNEQAMRSSCNRLSGKSVIAAVVMRRQVFGHLSRVHLRVMHALSCDEGVPFVPVPDRQDLRLNPELEGISQKLIAYARGAPYALQDHEEQLLRRRYIHRSAHWSAMIGSGGRLMDALFVHAPQRGGRVWHPNMVMPGYPL